MATIEDVYTEWEKTFKCSEESLFHYHPNLERILLGLAIFVISSRHLFRKLGKAEAFKLLPIYATSLITAWIDDNDEAFETMFKATMPVAEGYIMIGQALAKEYPSKAKAIRAIQNIYGVSVCIAGDMSDEKAEELLDDLSTDGNQLYSDKITALSSQLLFLTRQYGIDIPFPELSSLLNK